MEKKGSQLLQVALGASEASLYVLGTREAPIAICLKSGHMPWYPHSLCHVDSLHDKGVLDACRTAPSCQIGQRPSGHAHGPGLDIECY